MSQEEELPDFDKLWNFRDPAETERRFRELLPRATTAGNDAYRLELQTQIARTLGLQKKYDEAHALLDEVEKGLGGTGGARPRIRYLLERGRAYNSSDKAEKARPLFVEAWDLSVKDDEDFYAVDAAHMMGIVEPPEKQIEWSAKAMALAEKSRDERARNWLGPLYNNLGWTYFDLGRYEESLALQQKSCAFREAKGQARETRIAMWAIGRTLRALNRVDEALAQQEALLAAWQEAGEEDGFVYEELGECLLAQGEKEKASAWFAKALPLLEKIDWLDPARLARLRSLR